jgi:hypothetical protein
VSRTPVNCFDLQLHASLRSCSFSTEQDAARFGGRNMWGCEVGIRFPIVKILDYREREAELE